MNQRELFEAHFKPITGWDFYWSDSINQYMDHQTNAAWFGWQASAQRDGYKLVPLDPLEGMDMKICDLVNHRVDVFEADRIYKAMIGVVDSPLSFALNHAHNKLKENADRLIKHQDSQMGAAE